MCLHGTKSHSPGRQYAAQLAFLPPEEGDQRAPTRGRPPSELPDGANAATTLTRSRDLGSLDDIMPIRQAGQETTSALEASVKPMPPAG